MILPPNIGNRAVIGIGPIPKAGDPTVRVSLAKALKLAMPGKGRTYYSGYRKKNWQLYLQGERRRYHMKRLAALENRMLPLAENELNMEDADE